MGEHVRHEVIGAKRIFFFFVNQSIYRETSQKKPFTLFGQTEDPVFFVKYIHVFVMITDCVRDPPR